MANSTIGDLLGEILDEVAVDTAFPARGRPAEGQGLTNSQKTLLAASAVGAYVVARVIFSLLGLPALPNESSLLLQNQPLYAPLAAGVVLVGLTLLARPLVGGLGYDAPLLVAVIGLLALPTRGGDARNALLDAGGPSVYVRMAVELIFLALALLLGYVALFRRRSEPAAELPEVATPIAPTPIVMSDAPLDRLIAVALQTVLTLALLAFLGQSPLKGQAMLGLALSAGLASWIAYKTRGVRGSLWPVAGTLLAGLIAYLWTYAHPAGVAIGDASGLFAGAARSLPLHYATAGVAGAIYGHWTARTGESAPD